MSAIWIAQLLTFRNLVPTIRKSVDVRGVGYTSTGVLGNMLILYGRTVYLLRSIGVDSIPRTALILRLRTARLGVSASVSDHVSSSWMSLLTASMEMPVSESAPDNDSSCQQSCDRTVVLQVTP